MNKKHPLSKMQNIRFINHKRMNGSKQKEVKWDKTERSLGLEVHHLSVRLTSSHDADNMM